MTKMLLPLLLISLILAACTTPHQPPKPVEGADAPTVQSKAESAVVQAAATPFTDLNLVRAEIPEVLKAAQKDPYGSPADQSCPGLAAAVQALDATLGADLDT